MGPKRNLQEGRREEEENPADSYEEKFLGKEVSEKMFKLTPKQKFVGENLKEKTSLRGPQKEGSEPWESLKERGPKEFTSDLLKLVKDPKV